MPMGTGIRARNWWLSSSKAPLPMRISSTFGSGTRTIHFSANTETTTRETRMWKWNLYSTSKLLYRSELGVICNHVPEAQGFRSVLGRPENLRALEAISDLGIGSNLLEGLLHVERISDFVHSNDHRTMTIDSGQRRSVSTTLFAKNRALGHFRRRVKRSD